jgi:hypothetical protein
MSINWTEEWPRIVASAMRYGVQPAAVAAIRVAEDGAPGREFGVLSVPAPDYDSQLRVACESLAHRLETLDGDITVIARRGAALCYTQEFW